MFFTPIDEWLQQTRSLVYSRSEPLKKLDAAVKEANAVNDELENSMSEHFDSFGFKTPFDKLMVELAQSRLAAAVATVKQAFDDWANDQTRRGKNWRKSGRNDSGAVTTLYNQIVYLSAQHPSASTQAALDVITEQRNQSIPQLFKDCVCLSRTDMMGKLQEQRRKITVTKDAYTIASDSWKLAGSPRPGSIPMPHVGLPSRPGSGSQGGGIDATITGHIQDMIRSAFGVVHVDWHEQEAELRDLMTHAIGQIQHEIHALAPGVGLGAASATLVFQQVKLVMNRIADDDLFDLSRRLEAGDSRAALERVRDWLNREFALRSSAAARAAVNVGMHAAAIASCGVGVPAQLAVSIANTIIALAEIIADLGVQYKESRAITRYLADHGAANPPGRDIFAIAPLIGAYYLLNTPTSHIALQLVTIGAPGWQADVELLVKDGLIKTVVEQSARLISASRYRIVRSSGPQLRDRVGKTMTMKAKDKLASAKAKVGISTPTSKTKMSAISWTDSPALPAGD
jgi:hypothetical protein